MSHRYLVLCVCPWAAGPSQPLSSPTDFFHMLIWKPLLKDLILCPTGLNSNPMRG